MVTQLTHSNPTWEKLLIMIWIFTSQPCTLTLNKSSLNLTFCTFKSMFENYERDFSLMSCIIHILHYFLDLTLKNKMEKNGQVKSSNKHERSLQILTKGIRKKRREFIEKFQASRILIDHSLHNSLVIYCY